MDILVADIGGTNSRCSLAGPPGLIAAASSFSNRDFSGPAPLLEHYLASLPAPQRPRRAVLAIAAPIRGDAVSMINIGWRFSGAALRAQLGLEELRLLNDFAALAWALPALTAADLLQLGSGAAQGEAPRVVLGPGTGLGVAGLIAIPGGWQALPGEGGHVTLAAQDDQENRVISLARARFGHCSAERLLSGAGLSFLHEALHGGAPLAPDALGARIQAGDPGACATLELFFRLLGTVAGNVALTLGAFGGVYIAGGIVPRYPQAFLNSGFRERFEAKGRYRDYLRTIPTWLITRPQPTLTGLAAFARHAWAH